MKLQSVSLIGAITLSCALLSACGSKEEQPAPQAEVKPAVEEAAPVQEAAPEPAQEEPALVPIQSLSEEKPVPAEPAAPVSSVEQESSGPFVIQVSIQASKKAANNVVSKLSDQGIKAYVAEVENPGELEGRRVTLVGWITARTTALANRAQAKTCNFYKSNELLRPRTLRSLFSFSLFLYNR